MRLHTCDQRLSYQDARLVASLLKTLLLFSVLSGIYINDAGFWLSRHLSVRPLWVKDTVFFGVSYACFFLLLFPLEWWEDFWLERKHHLSVQSLIAWLTDCGKSFLVGGILLWGGTMILYFLLRTAGAAWPFWAWCLYIVVQGLLTMAVPQLIVPLFYRYMPLPEGEMKQDLRTLIEKAKISIREIYLIDASAKTRKANAFVCGLGKTRRLVLTDTLLQQFTSEEIRAAVAHELTHMRHRDTLLLYAIQTVVSFVFFFIVGKVAYAIFKAEMYALKDIGSLPFFALMALMFQTAASPFFNALLRWIERRTDQGAFALLGDTRGFISLIEKLTRQNKAEISPAVWKERVFFSHPAPSRRIQYAQQWKL